MDLVSALKPGATNAVKFLMDSLTQLVKEQVELIKDAEKDFNDLLKQVEPLNDLLAKGYAKQESNIDIKWRDLFDNIKRTVYRVEDVIDKKLVEAKLIQDSGLRDKLRIKFENLTKGLTKGQTMAMEIRRNLVEVKKIYEESQNVFDQNPQTNPQPQQSASAQLTQGPMEEDIEVVGFDEPAEDVKKRLLGGSKKLQIVPIVGMPGLGKTTLARKVFNHSGIQGGFYKTIWTYVGQSNNAVDILDKILKEFTGHTERYEAVESQLANIIHSFLDAGDNFLIVLDDVWDQKIVESVMKVFPDNERGNRIMMTTREGNVATSFNGNTYPLQPLSPEKSFELLEKRVFGKTIKCPIELQGHGKTIANKCSGVPLAIVVIAGALRGSRDVAKWRVVKENVGKHLVKEDEKDLTKNCRIFVEMSYNHLPQGEKLAFLFLGIFPPGFDIPAWKLIRLWVAEGLINSDLPGSEIEVIAHCYLNDFVSRNLLMVMKKRSDGHQIKTCRLHDMLHEFCNLEAKKVGLFHQICPKPSDRNIPSIDDPNTSRRLCIQSSIPYDVIPNGREVQHVRSLLSFSSEQKQIDLSNLGIKLIPRAFPLIRVLDIQPREFSFSKDFSRLFHLRYIALSGDFKAGLPSVLGNFWNLQTLILHHTNSSLFTLKVDEAIWKMLLLRHLHTDIPANLPPPPTQTSTSCSLQTLSKVTPQSCQTTVLAKACNVKKLGVQGRLAALLGANNESGFSSFVHLNCLESLKLLEVEVSEESSEESEEESDGNEQEIRSAEMLCLPPSFFRLKKTLRKLTLSGTKFDWSEADKLGQLEFLEVLKLKENAFVGDTWRPNNGSLSTLQVLWIDRAEDLETWDASERPFKNLRLLVLKSCSKLKAVPLDLADLPYLQEIRLEHTLLAIDSAKEIESMKIEMQVADSIMFKLSIYPPQAGA